MNSQDITEHKQPLSHAQNNVLIALLQGHIITIAGEDYRYAEAEQPLYRNNKDEIMGAMEAGLFKRNYEFDGQVTDYTPETCNRFSLMLYSSELAHIVRLIKTMTL